MERRGRHGKFFRYRAGGIDPLEQPENTRRGFAWLVRGILNIDICFEELIEAAINVGYVTKGAFGYQDILGLTVPMYEIVLARATALNRKLNPSAQGEGENG